jgi:Ca2+-binding RTX toxin-like protein
MARCCPSESEALSSLFSRFERLESRTLMSAALEHGVLTQGVLDPDRIDASILPLAAVSVEHGALTITGTDANDSIYVGVVSRQVDRGAWRGRGRVPERRRALYYEVSVIILPDGHFLRAAEDAGGADPVGRLLRIPVGKVRSIVVNAGAGDDRVVLGGDYRTNFPIVTFPKSRPAPVDAVVHGGDGADFIVGGRGNDLLYGEAGDDSMFGLAGLDTLDGGDGNDRLGDACEDRSRSTMLGGPGDDILVGKPAVSVDPGSSLLVPFAPHSMFGGPGNDQFQADASEVRDLEPGEGVSPAHCAHVY